MKRGLIMKLTILHDNDGNIAGLSAYAADGPPAYMETSLGQHVSVIEIPEITDQLGDQAIFDRLADIAENYRV